ncbi:hypothetical protein [Deinococcus radiophilus]|uniref:hypothetical protein n=1 Tax=Deinococcus radiophilus TaxID=32062 RepID=UPI003608299A
MEGEGRVMLLAPAALPPERFDHAFWQPLGMRASVSARVDLGGLTLPPGSEVGAPGDYYRQPEFGGGALRFLAAQLGGAEAVIGAAREVLSRMGRQEDPVQQLRFAAAAAQVEAAWQTVREGGAAWRHTAKPHWITWPFAGSSLKRRPCWPARQPSGRWAPAACWPPTTLSG